MTTYWFQTHGVIGMLSLYQYLAVWQQGLMIFSKCSTYVWISECHNDECLILRDQEQK